MTPQLLQAAGFWPANRTPTYFRIVLDNEIDPPINSGNIGFTDVWVISAPESCFYISPNVPGAIPITMQLWVGNDCGEDFCETFIVIWDLDGVCL